MFAFVAVLEDKQATIVVGLYLFPRLFCMIRTGRTFFVHFRFHQINLQGRFHHVLLSQVPPYVKPDSMNHPVEKNIYRVSYLSPDYPETGNDCQTR